MAIPRLAPSANVYTGTVTVNKVLRPYFEVWYQEAKLAGENPEAFMLRVLKLQAQNHHIQKNIKAERDAAEQAKLDYEASVQADIEAFGIEAD